MTYESMCLPQPDQVGFLQVEHSVLEHIVARVWEEKTRKMFKDNHRKDGN